jgi:Filamin/ABP280 repeat
MEPYTGAEGRRLASNSHEKECEKCDQLHVGDNFPPAQVVGSAPIILEQAVTLLFADSDVPHQDLTITPGHANGDRSAAAAVGTKEQFPNESSSSDEDDYEEKDAASLSGPIDPEQCTASGPGITGGSAGTSVNFLVRTKDTSGRFLAEGGAYIVVTIENQNVRNQKNSHAYIQAQVIDNTNGTYKIFYSVPEKGSYQIDIKINGAAITGSPFPVYFSAPVPGEIPLVENVSYLTGGARAAGNTTVGGGGGGGGASEAYNAMLQQQNALAQQVAELRTAQKAQVHTNTTSAVAAAAAAARRLAAGANGAGAALEKKESRYRERSRSPGRRRKHDSSKDHSRGRSRSRSRDRKRDQDHHHHRHHYHRSSSRDQEEDTKRDGRHYDSLHRRHRSISRGRGSGSHRREEKQAASRITSIEQTKAEAVQKDIKPVAGDELEDLLKELEDT